MKKIVFSVLFFLFLIPFMAYGQNDLFQVKTPNVMIVFDTSNSMDNQPSGWSQGSGNAVGIDGKTYNFEGGSNHPNSKLYQAKSALNQIIDSVVKDRVNLGFSTYAQFKTDIRRGYYQRDRRNYTAPTSDQYRWNKLYWRFNNYAHGAWTSYSFAKDSFTDVWGFLRTGVSVGYTFTIVHTFDNSPNNDGMSVPPPHPPGTYVGNLTIKVTSITYNPEMNWYTFAYSSVSHDHYETTYRYLYFPTNNPIDCDTQFSKTWNSGSGPVWNTYKSTDAVQQANPAKWACQGPVLIPGSAGGFGNWYKEYSWLQFSATSCPPTSGVDNFPPNATQTSKWSLVGSCYDYSTYYYPADGSNDKPHTWSYFKVNGGKWPNNQQTPNYYPSLDGGGNLNMTPGTYDDHFFFINFPDDKAANFHDSDRTTVTNLIKSFLDLTPVQSPETGRYWTKLPLHDTYGKKGLTSNTQASSFTPLADSLADAYRYFYDYIYNYKGGDPSSQEKFGDTLCRGNYIILLTDGLESCRFSGGNPDYNAAPQEAANLLTINVKTFVIGFGGDIKGNQTLTNIASAGGTGKAYFASNLNELKGALQSIFQAITGQYYGRSNPVIARERSRLYRGNFDIKDGDWMGHLMAWDADKQTGVLAPDFAWDAGEKITINGRGIVYTWTDTGLNPPRKQFQASESSLYSLVNPLNEDINGDTLYNDNDAQTIINFTLDSSYDGAKYKGQRAINVDINGTIYPAWNLGDVYHSTPVPIGEPAFFFTENDYATFYNNNKNREMIIYVGTNDGMLHAIKNSDGTEKFAIIPKNLLGKLKDLRIAHGFYVDSSPKAYDVYFKAESKWKTVLISGERGGGPYYFAIDVTNPNDPKILWQWPNLDIDPEYQNMGETWAKPEIGKVKVGSDTKFVAFLTGGYSTTDDKGNSFYIVDIETGTTLKMWTQSNGYPVGSKTNKIVSAPTAYDVNQDGFIDYVYFGDIEGTLWKVDVSSTAINDWTLYNFFSPSHPKPIFYSPSVVKNDEGKALIFFGTGNELGLTTLDSNYFYEIEDQGTSGNEKWKKDLETGEKVLASPAVANYVVYFTTWVYKAAGEFCGAGEGRLWGLKISSTTQKGGDAGLVTLDPNTGKWTSPQEYISLGAGIPTAPVVTNGMVYVSTSLNAQRVIQIPIPPWAVAKIKSWREVVR
jgi:hypothetical protein